MSGSESIVVIDQAKEALRTLLTHMGLDAEVAAAENDERVQLEIKGPETALTIGKKGQTLDALQYLVNKIVARKLPEGDEGKAVSVDAEGYRERRAEVLVELAHKLAADVKRTGRPVAADAMSPADRRIMHVALAESVDVMTRSEGEGVYRHLVILPKSAAVAAAE